MQGGNSSERQAYYLKTERGAWIRCCVDDSRGVVILSAQRRVVDRGDHFAILDHEDEEVELVSKRPDIDLPFGWHDLFEIGMDHPSWPSVGKSVGWEILRESVVTHAACLLCQGYSAEESLGGFRDLGSREFLHETEYVVVRETPKFAGLLGAVLTILEIGAQSIACHVQIAGESFEVELTGDDAAISVLQSSAPVVE